MALYGPYFRYDIALPISEFDPETIGAISGTPSDIVIPGAGPVLAVDDTFTWNGVTYTVTGHAADNPANVTAESGGNYFVFSTSDTAYTLGAPAPGKIVDDVTLTCFLEGTLIATPEGERAVESLAIGELILTADGRSVPVKWVGRQRVNNHAIFASAKMEPVCISAGALGGGLPHSDLYVTAAHGMIWEGLVVNAGALVNGTTIRFVPLSEMPEVVTWYHIETEGHEEILAHGAPTETFVDYVGRSRFDNHQEYLDLYGAERIIPEMKRPRVSAQRMLPDHLRARLGLPALGAEIAAEAGALVRRLKAA